MITKERLDELAGQGATIYHLIAKNYEEIGANDIPQYKLYNWEFYKEYYFETEEDARWELEMTATRTETLKLPTYEKVFEQDRCLDCYTKEFAIIKTDIVIGVCLFGVDFTNKIIEVSVGADKMFVGELTKENYIEACKLCLRLFKGE